MAVLLVTTWKLLFSNFDDGRLDHVFEFLLGLIPYHEAFAAGVGWYVGLPKLDGLGLAGFPVFKGHKLFGHVKVSPRGLITRY